MATATRATRTESYLLEALLDLARTKGMRKVQVRELCEAAQVNRSTFYKHYEDVDGFLHRVIEGFLSRMKENLGGRNLFEELSHERAEQTYRLCADFMARNADFIRAMLGPNGMPEFREAIEADWRAQFHEAVASGSVVLGDRVEEDVLCCFAVAAMWGGLVFTVRDNERYSTDYLARQLSFLFHDCVLGRLNG